MSRTIQTFHGKNTIQLGIFYSSLADIYNRKPQNFTIPDPDIFCRTSGEKRVGDIMLRELQRSRCMLLQYPLNLAEISTYKVFRIITSWQRFCERRNRLEAKDPARFDYKNVHKSLEDNELLHTTSFREDSGVELWSPQDECHNRANF